jgi:splicing factor 3B subunit 3
MPSRVFACDRRSRYVRQEAHSVVGRDHLMYRSYYVPVKDVIDGDL